MKSIKNVLTQTLFILLTVTIVFSARAQSFTSDLDPMYSGSAAPYNSDVEIKVTTAVSGTYYYVVTRTDETISNSNVVLYAGGASAPFPIERRGSFAATLADPQIYTVADLDPHVDYWFHIVLKNSTTSAVQKKTIRTLEAHHGGVLLFPVFIG